MKPRLLDLFAGAGGCSVGYARAGFDVTGVDNKPHPDYPFDMIVADALDVLADTAFLNGFVVVHASPPCQLYTTMSNRSRVVGGAAADWPDLIGPVRDALLSWGGAYVIENVPGARSLMRNPITLHGGMFGLGVDRPRLFESNVFLMPSEAPRVTNPVGVYGKLDGRRLFTRADGSNQHAAKTLAQAQAAMGIDWMSWDDLREAIPPAYTEFIGAQLMEQHALDSIVGGFAEAVPAGICGIPCPYGGTSSARKYSRSELGWHGHCNRKVSGPGPCWQHRSTAAA